MYTLKFTFEIIHACTMHTNFHSTFNFAYQLALEFVLVHDVPCQTHEDYFRLKITFRLEDWQCV